MVESDIVELSVLDDGGGARVVSGVNQGQHLVSTMIQTVTFERALGPGGLVFQSWVVRLRESLTLVAVGIHHLDLPRGGRDLSAGGNWRMVISCSRFLTSDNVTPGADI